MIKKTHIMLALILLFAGTQVIALDCNYDSEPYLSKSIDFVCTTTNPDTSKCLGLVLYNDSLIHIYPERKKLFAYGMIEYFESRNGTKLVNVQFEKDDIYNGITYEFKVLCASLDGNALETFSVNITPVNPTLSNIPARGVWLKDNMGVLVFIFGALIFVIVMIRLFTKHK